MKNWAGDRPRRPRKGSGTRKRTAPQPPQSKTDAMLGRLMAYGGYMGAGLLIYQTIANFSKPPVWGAVWSPAIIGVLLGVVTASYRNDFGMRDRLPLFDEAASRSLRGRLTWFALGAVAIVAIMTFPQY